MTSILFLLRKSNGKKVKYFIYCRLTINGLRQEFSINEVITCLSDWDSTRERLAETTDLNRVINTRLETIVSRLKKIILHHELNDESVTPESVVRELFSNKKKKTTFLELLSRFLINREKDTEKNYSLKTIEKDRYFQNNITKYLIAAKQRTLLPEQFKPAIAEELKMWLYKNLKSCGKTHNSRHLELTQNVLDYAVSIEEIKYNPLAYLETGRDKRKEVVALNAEQLNKLIKSQLVGRVYNIVRDLFVFQCMTGLSYADLYTFKTSDEGWIHGDRSKKQIPYIVPFFTNTIDIIKKYNGELPKITNQAYNRIIKELFAFLEINIYVTTHVGRKTFASLKNSDGWSTESISFMLGHKSVKTTENYYINRKPARIVNEMNRLGIQPMRINA